jgi:hypothetical protein
MKKLLLLTSLLISPGLFAAENGVPVTDDAVEEINHEDNILEILYDVKDKARRINDYLTERHITNLDLSLSNFNEEKDVERNFFELKIIAEMLAHNSTLTSLKLEVGVINDIDEEEENRNNINCIEKALMQNSTLTSLDLSDSDLGYLIKGARMAKVLNTNPTLTSLILRGNDIAHFDSKDFAELIRINSTLRYLDLRNNSFEIADTENLVNALKDNHTLLKLDLGEIYGDPMMTDDQKRQINEYLTRNHNEQLTNTSLTHQLLGALDKRTIRLSSVRGGPPN